MRKLILLAVVCLGIGAAHVAAQELGTVHIPAAVTIKDTAVAAGTYTVTLSKNSDGTMISLANDAGTVVSELAVQKKTAKQDDPAVIAFERLKRDSGFNPVARIRISYQGTLFMLYCGS